MSDHCECCLRPGPTSIFKCGPCERWVCTRCWNKTAKTCGGCAERTVG